MPTTKVAVVTGANKGIGYAIVKGLCEKYDGKVYLTARDINRGKAAVDQLRQLGLNPSFHQLDITDQSSLNTFRNFIIKTDGGIDILINNAGVGPKDFPPTLSFGDKAQATIEINYFGNLRTCEILFPIIRSHGKVIHLSSAAGHLSQIPSAELRSKFSNPTLTINGLNNLMNEFINAAKTDKHVRNSWGDALKTPYSVSKVGLGALTIIQQMLLDQEADRRDISVNCVHPGYVATDMSSHKGPLTTEEGATAPLYLALEPHGLRGQYVWYNSKPFDWFASSAPSLV